MRIMDDIIYEIKDLLQYAIENRDWNSVEEAKTIIDEYNGEYSSEINCEEE